MKNYFLFFVTGLVVTCSSCRKNPQPEPEVPQPPRSTTLTTEEAERFVLLNTDYAVSEAEILKQAEVLAEMFDGAEARSKTRLRRPVVSDSIVSALALTKADGSEAAVPPTIYVVTFGPEGGFALFAGDKRAGGVLAYSDAGDFRPNDLPPVVEYFVGCLKAYMLSEIDRREAMRGDSIYNALVYRYGRFGDRRSEALTKYPVWNGIEYVDMPVDNITEEFYDYGGEISAKCLLVNAQWGQGWPYNTKVAATYGSGIPVGCVATAVAQIMDYHKTGTYNGKTYTWDQFPTSDWKVSTDVLNSIGELFFDLGRPENLHMNYKIEGSGADSDDVPRTLAHFGYTSTDLKKYSASSTLDNLQNNRPVYMRGEDPASGNGHAWVVGGWARHDTYTVYRINYWYEGHLQGSEYVKRDIQSTYSFHLNWGWSGQYNCWASPGTFDAKIYNFKNETKMIRDIRPL